MLEPAVQLKYVSRGFSRWHSGADLIAPWGSPIRAALGGRVIYAGWFYGYGEMIDIRAPDGTVTRYGHLSRFATVTKVGATVATGALIGFVGATGDAHGAHLHFEVRVNGKPIDPEPYIGLEACHGIPGALSLEEAQAPKGPAPINARPGGLFQ